MHQQTASEPQLLSSVATLPHAHSTRTLADTRASVPWTEELVNQQQELVPSHLCSGWQHLSSRTSPALLLGGEGPPHRQLQLEGIQHQVPKLILLLPLPVLCLQGCQSLWVLPQRDQQPPNHLPHLPQSLFWVLLLPLFWVPFRFLPLPPRCSATACLVPLGPMHQRCHLHVDSLLRFQRSVAPPHLPRRIHPLHCCFQLGSHFPR
mmetsp:Transcript_41552/g.70014  ORF Transcript_41552/g.70014 Transcript_41552/m.70014 type:complete len:206 (+) Transcript_41552:1960-2577(+)